MKNIYCRDSKLSSWCLRILVERYIAGDTASEAKQFIEGVPKTDDQGCVVKDADSEIYWKIEPHLEPAQKEMEELFNAFLSSAPMHYEQIATFANERAVVHPYFWKEIKISRPTINRYFLLLGKYCWENLVAHKYYQDARRVMELALSTHKDMPFKSLDKEVEMAVQGNIEEFVKWANGSLVKEKGKYIRKLEMMTYLEQRSKKFNGLKLKYAREHVAWASLVGEVEGRGRDRRDLAQILAHMMINEPL